MLDIARRHLEAHSLVIDEYIMLAAHDVERTVIGPMCRWYGLTYKSGMGTWFFEKDGKILFDGVWSDVESCPADWAADYEAARDALHTVVGGITISDYTRDYIPPTED